MNADKFSQFILAGITLAVATAGLCQTIDKPTPDKPVPANSQQDKPGTEPETKPAAVSDSTNKEEPPTKPYKPNCNAPDNHGDADFCQQARMVEASEDLLDLTTSQIDVAREQVGVSRKQLSWNTIEVVGLLLSVAFTAYAALSAARAANAAQSVLKTERAWISAASAYGLLSVHTTKDDAVYPYGFMFFTRWVNSGRTPALKLGLYAELRVVPIDSEVPSFAVDWEGDVSAAAYGPGVGFTTDDRGIIGEQYDAVFNRRAKVILFSEARYLDIFDGDTWRYSRSCYVFVYDGIRHHPDGRTEPRFVVKPLGPQNTAT